MNTNDTDDGDWADRHGEAFFRDNGGGRNGDSEENLLHDWRSISGGNRTSNA